MTMVLLDEQGGESLHHQCGLGSILAQCWLGLTSPLPIPVLLFPLLSPGHSYPLFLFLITPFHPFVPPFTSPYLIGSEVSLSYSLLSLLSSSRPVCPASPPHPLFPPPAVRVSVYPRSLSFCHSTTCFFCFWWEE